MNSVEKEVVKDITPIVDLFSCADGGAALVKLRGLLTDIYPKDDANSAEFKLIVKRFSKLCDLMLKRT
jgi:hypothetical protein